MRVIIIVLLAVCLQVSASAFSQKISLSVRDARIEKILEAVKLQSGFLLFYDYDLIKEVKPLTINVKDASVTQVMDLIVKGQLFDYTIQKSTIILKKKPSFFEHITTSLFGDDIEIKGHVYSDGGDPLSGAYVSLKGNSKKIAITNANGEFTLHITKQEATQGILVFSYVGYNKYEYKVSGHNNVNITLSKNIQALSDVVVTNSYSKPKRKEEVTGSISVVTSKELQTDRPIESFDKMLEGLVAGVQVETNTELGTPVKVNIRGQNSLTNLNGANITTLTTSSQPLYIIDGVPVMEQRRSDEPLAFINNEELLNPLAGINPADIESISVLKDAAAASIYGANASNGVIIITTKKGKAGKTKLDIGYSNGWAQSINGIKWLNGPQYHTLMKEELINDGKAPDVADILAGSSTMNTPWFELANRYSTFDNAEVEVSGGSEATQFRLSGSFYNQQAIQKGNDYKKIYFRARIDHKINSQFSFGVTLAPSITNKHAVNVYGIVPIIPNVPVYNADSTFFSFANLGVPNPLAVIAQNTDYATGGTFNFNTHVEYTPIKNLRFYTLVGIDALQNKGTLFQSPKNATGASKGGFEQIFDRSNFSWISTSQVNWTPTFKQVHKLDVTVGFEAKSEDTKLLSGSATGFTYSKLIELSTATNHYSASSLDKTNSYSVVSQILYNYDAKYYVSLSSRLDGASIYGKDVQYAVNSGFGIGWLINKENLFRQYDWLDMFRLRVSYGRTGNSRINSYSARGLYSFETQGYNDIVSSYISTAPNPYLTWEAGYKQNTGIDFSFLKRFNITVDIYKNTTINATNPVSIPPENGFTTMLANVADMSNKGFDASISAQLFTGKFRWTSTLNVGYNKNVVTKVYNKTSYYSSDPSIASVLKVGVSTSSIWGFRFAGIDPVTGYEQFYDNTGKVVSAKNMDRTPSSAYSLGDRLPKAQGGFINTFSYMGVSLTVNLLYNIGGYLLIDYNNENNGRNLSNRNQSVNLLDRWSKVGDIATIPRLASGIYGTGNPIVANSSRYVYDNTYIKLSNVSLAYTIPKNLTKRFGGLGLTFYGNGTNLFYWYKQKSPAGRNGIKEYRFSFPEAQTFTWGVKVGI